MTCPHDWSVTSECPKCLRTELNAAIVALADIWAMVEHNSTAAVSSGLLLALIQRRAEQAMPKQASILAHHVISRKG